jgi:hypothetical protein
MQGELYVAVGTPGEQDLHTILAAPLPTPDAAGPGGAAVARDLAHHLGRLADTPDLPPWLTQFRTHLFAVSDRYWAGLFHCDDIVGLPPTNNDHEQLYGQVKRHLRRQRGVSQLREPLLRHGAWRRSNWRPLRPQMCNTGWPR